MPPIHDYECVSCHMRFEALIKRDESVTCPKCGSQQLELKMSAPSGYKIKGNNSASTTPKKFRG